MNPGWNGTLGLYSDFLRAAAATRAWKVADIHSPMTEFNRAQQEINPKFSVVSPDDRVHPNAAGWFQKKVPDYIGNWPGRAATRAKIDAMDRELDALRKPVARA